jgi:hypothetical protein
MRPRSRRSDQLTQMVGAEREFEVSTPRNEGNAHRRLGVAVSTSLHLSVPFAVLDLIAGSGLVGSRRLWRIPPILHAQENEGIRDG